MEELMKYFVIIAPKLKNYNMSGRKSVKKQNQASAKKSNDGDQASAEKFNDGDQAAENQACQGTRNFHEITIETVNGKTYDVKIFFSLNVSCFILDEENVPAEGQDTPTSSKESSPALTEKAEKPKDATRNISFVSGNPFVGICFIYSDMTSLEDEVERSEMICIIAVPASMTSHDLLQFTAPVSPDIENMRIVRDTTPNQYMVLIKFRSQESADLFYKNYDGVPFNSIEPETCHLVYVAKVETTKDTDTGSLPLSGHTELPTCPVCLERMDESVDGILTILCNHSFHGSCLSKWGDTSCPVCRYCQTPEAVPDNKCFECHSQESLWICLICGYVGCGRYVEGHAFTHFQGTQHTYSMQLNNNRVWDYAGDNYVHRLVQNKSDGKLVEWNESAGNQVDSDEKMDSIQLEMDELKERTMKAVENSIKFEQKFSNMNKEKQSHEKKISQVNNKLQKTISELKEEKEINKCLRQNQQMWNNKVKELEKELKLTKDKKDSSISSMWPKNHRRNPLSGWDVVALAATAGASPAPSGRPHPTPPGYPQWHAVHTYHIPRHDIRNHPQRPLLRARRYRWLDPYLVTHSKRAVVATLNLHKVDVKRYTPKGNPHPGFPTPASPAQEISELKEQIRDLMFYLEAQSEITKASSETREEIREGQIVMGASAPASTHSKHRKKK
ncbi:BRCA1-associated protein [Nymphon striatum]|nr:BRCA1-associated protein [Nymphon striatum]